MKRLIWLIGLAGLLAGSLELGAEEGNDDKAFSLFSSVIEAGGSIDTVYTCDGLDVSPPLLWENAPDGTRSFALICDDPDAPLRTWVHWVIYNIPATARQLPEAVPAREKLQEGTLQGKNDFGRIGYGGPCPPRGKPHRYFFKIYALDEALPLASGLVKKALLSAIEDHVLAEAEFFGLYGRR